MVLFLRKIRHLNIQGQKRSCMVVIRLARGGSKKRPFYHVVATDKRNPRDGRHIEMLGYFNPIASGKDIALKLNIEKIKSWQSKGAQLSERVASLVAQYLKNQEVEAA